MSWNLQIVVDPSSGEPVFLQIARAVTDDVRRGRLRPGDRLPGSRRLAGSLGVHRNTVLAAYDELVAEGWLEARTGSGTFVSPSLPDPEASPGRGTSAGPGFDLLGPAPPSTYPWDQPVPRGALLLGGGLPDLRSAPVEQLARAYRRALRQVPGRLLSYGDPRGLPRLRAALAGMLAARRGLAVDPDDILVTRGSQMGLYLVARSLVQPGDRVAVEGLGYDPAWRAFRAAGAELVPVEVDGSGIRVDRLEEIVDQAPIRAVYVTPHHQYPTMGVLPAARRMRLLALAARRRFAVIEDDYDNEFHYQGRPVLPLAASDRDGVVVYISTLSKVLAPGLRLGWVAGPRALIDRLAALRRIIDRQGDQVTERAIAELIEDDTVPRHIRRMRRVYARRQALMVDELTTRLGGALTVDVPQGGMVLWPRVADDLDADAWAEACRSRGAILAAGRLFDFHRAYQPHFRMGYGCLDDEEIPEAVRRMAEALREVRPGVRP